MVSRSNSLLQCSTTMSLINKIAIKSIDLIKDQEKSNPESFKSPDLIIETIDARLKLRNC